MKKFVLVATVLVGGLAISQAGVNVRIGIGLPLPPLPRPGIGAGYPAPVYPPAWSFLPSACRVWSSPARRFAMNPVVAMFIGAIMIGGAAAITIAVITTSS